MLFTKNKARVPQPTYLDGSVVHRDHTGHDVNDPLRHDHHVGTQELCVEELHGTQVMQKLHSLDQLKHVYIIYMYVYHTFGTIRCFFL